jgi:hypothetical protein
MTIPIAPLIGFAVGLYPSVESVMEGNIHQAAQRLGRDYIGYDYTDGTFDVKRAYHGLAPLFMGALVHTAASKLGINRALGRAKVPLVRI